MTAWTASSCNFVRTTKPRPIAGSDRRTANVAMTSVGRSPDPSPQTVVPASLFSLPFPDSTFSAGWSMSTFQHVPDERIDEALAEFVRVLVPGAPVTFASGPSDWEYHVASGSTPTRSDRRLTS